MSPTSTLRTAAHERETAEALLRIVHDFHHEIHRGNADHLPIHLDSTFDRDLGFDSLSRMELLSRVEKHFGATLPEPLFAETDTPRDLLRAILIAGRAPAGATPPPPSSALTTATSDLLPFAANTLNEVLEWHAAAHPDRPHIRLFSDDGEGKVITYGELSTESQTVAAGLLQLGLEPGQPVALMLPTGREYFRGFFGILAAGGIPVPVYPPARASRIEEHLQRLRGILGNCRAVILITPPDTKKTAQLLKVQVETLRHIVTIRDLSSARGGLALPAVSPDNIAFLQYTSGSTGNPKGVVLTHANLLANVRAMGARVEVDSRDVFVSWLPLYHDMGLIGSWLGSLYFAAPLVVMSPLAFLSRPLRWLQAIHRFRGTLSASPNFGYELCLRRIDDQELKGLDLSSWRAAFNGAEPVSPETLCRFRQRFEPLGFRPETMMPVYGLAENSVGLAFPSPGRIPLIDTIDREAFMRDGDAVPVPETEATALRFVACGRPLDGHQIRIVTEGGRELPDRKVGFLEFRGPSATSGYYRNPEQTARLFHGEWLNSGDLAYLAGGEVYLTGRAKDLIIRAGRNIYPPELEDAVGKIDGIRPGCVVAFGCADPDTGTEKLVIAAETRRHDENRLNQFRARINAVVADLVGEPPDEVVLAPPNAIPKTSSGKLKRAASRDLYQKGELGKPQKAVWLQMIRLTLSGLVPELRRARRRLKELLFGVYARTLFWLLAAPTWLLVALSPNPERRWKTVARIVYLLAGATGTPISVSGLENLPEAEKPCLYVSNHASYLDGPLLMATLPRRFSFVAKKELQANPLARRFLDRIGTEYVERFDAKKGTEDFQRLADRSRAGQSLCFFPEGTFTRAPGLLPFHMGAFAAAAEAGVLVVPVAIRGTRSILRANSWLPHRGALSVVIGPPLDAAALKREGEDSWSLAIRLRDGARDCLLRSCGEPDLGRERPLVKPPAPAPRT
ncbi:MAG: AMP-binding protein [Deltaproteobacteria bacterium]|nr:AMP-binding protein [Deltaproteobacteria bacterium]